MELPAPVKLPYFRPAAGLPGPLPTADEIGHATKSELSPRRNFLGDGGGICLIRDIYIVKAGKFITENEGNALLFIEKHLSIPAPRLYAMYRDQHSGNIHLVMEYFHGVNLESVWTSLPAEDRSSIATQLRPIFTQMRSLGPPPGFIGGVCGGVVPDNVFATLEPDPDINGPFKTVEEVGSAMALKSQKNWEECGRHVWTSGFFARNLATALKNHGVNFTHADLHMRNIIVDKVLTYPKLGSAGTLAAESDQQPLYHVRGIVDWESAGWYPAYWEYASAVARPHSGIDWPAIVDATIEPYPLEFSMLFIVLQDLQLIF